MFQFGDNEPSPHFKLLEQRRGNLGASGSDTNSVIRGQLWIAETTVSFYKDDVMISRNFEIFSRILERHRINFDGYNQSIVPHNLPRERRPVSGTKPHL